jgi:hypothetical protein
MTRLRAERPRSRARFRSGTKKSSLHTMSKLAYGPTQPPTQWVLRVFLMRVKRPGCDAELLRPIVEWSYISAPPYTFMTWCFFRHTGIVLVVWRHRSPTGDFLLYHRILYLHRLDCVTLRVMIAVILCTRTNFTRLFIEWVLKVLFSTNFE